MDDDGLIPKPCTDVYNAAFCVKLIGRYEGTLLFLGNICGIYVE